MSTHFMTLETVRGPITAELFDRDCPATVEHFERLVHDGFYAGTRIHEVVPGALVQGGDPRTRERSIDEARLDTRLDSGPSVVVRSEVIGNRNRPDAGAFVMVPNPDGTSGSQFAVVLDDAQADALRRTHTVFARVTEGMDVARALRPGDTIVGARIRE
jgi:cyclophilin family peptidyl-prolyl cis-trans isomerase